MIDRVDNNNIKIYKIIMHFQHYNISSLVNKDYFLLKWHFHSIDFGSADYALSVTNQNYIPDDGD